MHGDPKSPKMVENLLSHTKTDLTSKVISFYTQAGVADAGEIAGTVVFGFLVQAPILNLFGDRLGEYTGSALSTSLVFTDGAMQNGKEVAFEYNGSLNERFTRTVALLSKISVPNGSWACDYLTGLFVIKKANTNTSQTITSYKVRVSASSSGSGVVDTEFPAASPITDDYANPTTTDVKSFGMLWDGTNWDRWYGNSTLGGKVQNTLIPQAQDDTQNVIAVRTKPANDSAYAWPISFSGSLEASRIARNTPGMLKRVQGRIDSSAPNNTYYLMYLNHATLPADGAVNRLKASEKIIHTNGTNTYFDFEMPEGGVWGSVGVLVCLSTTEVTKTLAGAYLSLNVYTS